MKKKNYINLIMAMVLAIVLVGCGGGSGGAGSGMGDNEAAETDTSKTKTTAILKLPGQQLDRKSVVAGAMTRITDAAQKAPVAGHNSVTQSSAGNNQVDVAVVHAVDGSAFEVINTVESSAAWSIVDADKVAVLEAPGWQDGAALKKDFPDGSGTLYVNAYTDIDPPRHYVKNGDTLTGQITWSSSSRTENSGTLNGVPGQFYYGHKVVQYNSVYYGNVPDVDVVANLKGDFYFVPDDKSKADLDDDTDYLSIGYWLYTPEDMEQNKYEMGVFADGSDPFNKDDIKQLRSDQGYEDATYSGDAVGLHVSKAAAGATPVINAFTADVKLTANFGRLTTLGSVTGEVFNFKVGGEAKKSMDLTLDSADITEAADGGFFSGDTTQADGGFTGKWSGRFFSNNTISREPGSAAGTFGAARGDDLESYIGTFGVYNDHEWDSR